MLWICRALRSDADATFDMRIRAIGHRCVPSSSHEQQQVRV
jgi:hypothetical protein